jgi:hypothetical protein
MTKTQTYILVGGGLVLAYLLFFRTSTVKLSSSGSSSTTAKVSAWSSLVSSVGNAWDSIVGRSVTSSSSAAVEDSGS